MFSHSLFDVASVFSKKKFTYSLYGLPSKQYACITCTFSWLSWLTGGSVEGAKKEADEEGRWTPLWIVEDSTCTPEAENRFGYVFVA